MACGPEPKIGQRRDWLERGRVEHAHLASAAAEADGQELAVGRERHRAGRPTSASSARGPACRSPARTRRRGGRRASCSGFVHPGSFLWMTLPPPAGGEAAAVGGDGGRGDDMAAGVLTLCSIRPVVVSMMWKLPFRGATRCCPSGAKAAGPIITSHHARSLRAAGFSSSSFADAGRPHGVLGDELARLDVPDAQVEIVAPGEQSPAARPEADCR